VTFSPAPFSLEEAEIFRWRQDQRAAQFAAKITAEVLLIAGQQMRGPGMDRGLQNGLIFLRKPYIGRERGRTRHDSNSIQKPLRAGRVDLLRPG